ncbi:unnamed protein product [Anisakis simplex]|uniref:SCP domain-containing protein n=1 Tax=Anisakis simplex TaxID=6269 RepID=A0A0M3JRE8_ANISI|nr:unnamed protein product [Anisakis simplex]
MTDEYRAKALEEHNRHRSDLASGKERSVYRAKNLYKFVCAYSRANYPGQQIYEFGNGCSQNSDCTLYSGSTCERSTNLCIAPGYTAPEPNPRPKPPVTPSPSGQRCTSNVMTDTLRKLVAKRHNALRRDVALGKLRNVDTARNMYYLDYDCDLERRAQEYAERCDITSSPPGSISYDGTNKKPGSVSEAITSSMQQWAQPVKDGQVRAEIFSQNNPNPTATQMIWGSTTRVGCGVAMNCNVYWEGNYYETVITVCMYEQPGNRPGEQIYERGRACNSASDCTTFPGSSCKKKIGLCRKK